MNDLYLTGGEGRRTLFLPTAEWHVAKKAVALRVDAATGKIAERCEYLSPADTCADVNPAITFKAATLWGKRLYTCTSTEVITFELPAFRRVGYISLPCFNDLHHVLPTPNGTLIVVVTGLDLVMEITTDGEVLHEWSVVGDDTWSRFSRRIDYRKVPSTKPHRAHPNFAFLLGDDIWATRCDLKDAVCLTASGRRIDIPLSFPHDGHIFGDWIYFTTVDGHIVIANTGSLKVEQVFDLNVIDNHEGRLLGFCRGVFPLSETLVWVGFTRLRPTKFAEKLHWIKGTALDGKPTHVALYDLCAGRCLREIELAVHGMDLIFSVVALTGADNADLLAPAAVEGCIEQQAIG